MVAMRKKVVIALHMASTIGQRKLTGISKYLSDAYGADSPWNVQLVRSAGAFTPTMVRKAVADGVSGFLVSVVEADASMDVIATARKPTVVMDMHYAALERKGGPVVFVSCSSEKIGEVAAKYLIGQGMARTYAFLHPTNVTDWSRARYAAFKSVLHDNCRWCSELFRAEDVLKLKRPIAVFAANDECAVGLLRILEARRVKVPRDVAVLGVDNDAFVCENSRPRLSSVQPDGEKEGYIAAKLLDAIMNGRKPDSRVIEVGVRDVIRRESSSVLSQAGHLVQRAVTFIDNHALEGIDVEDVVEHLKCSRRLADLRFRQLQGRSMHEAIEARRLGEVRRLLAETNEKIDAIAAACGYESPNYLRNLFRRRFAMTMSDFRNSVALAP